MSQTVSQLSKLPLPSNAYHFISQWRVFGSMEEVQHILSDPAQLPTWWPAVYLGVTVLDPGQDSGLGRIIDLYTKGWLPYTLRWKFTVTEVTATTVKLAAEGDFIGTGQWTFTPDGDWTRLTYDWQITAEKPLLKALSFLLKPIFSMNHHWAMHQGEISLQLAIARLRAETAEARALIPAPPPPTPSSPLPLLAISAAGLALGVWLVRQVQRAIFRR